jgi:putative membrane protein
MKDKIITFLKGMWIGGTMTVPGVSGGSMAMILGIYNKLIRAIATFTKNVRKNIVFLGIFVIGGLLGVLIFSKYIITPLLENFPLVTGYFFLGAVAGGVPIIIKTAGVKKFTHRVITFPLLGMIPILILSFMPSGLFNTGEGFSVTGLIVQIFGGIFVAAALVLPGISVSQVLLMMGIYERLMLAIGSFDFETILFFAPLIFGVVLGILLVTKFMNMALERFPQVTYLTVFGFLLASVPQLIFEIGYPKGMQIPLCIITAVLGFMFIYILQKAEEKGSEVK